MTDQEDAVDVPAPSAVLALDRVEALQLLGSISYGRVVFTQDALPAIRPVNHLVHDGRVIIRTRVSAKISAAVRLTKPDVVVAYQADSLDAQRQEGWSVVIIGRAHTLTDPDEVARYERLLHPWVNEADTVVAIEPDIVTGARLIGSGTTARRDTR